MRKRVAVVLSGCGVLDGSEIHEAVITLLALAKSGDHAICCAPDIPQAEVINHVHNAASIGEGRSVLVESARIARGQIRPLGHLVVDEIDAMVLPGGFGAAKNLCDFAQRGSECEVNGELSRLIRQMHAARKPIGAMCIAPVLVARVLGHPDYQPALKVELTIGNDKATAEAIEAMGAQHVVCPVDSVVVDESNRVVSTPAYMLATSPAEVEAGVNKLVAAVIRLCG